MIRQTITKTDIEKFKLDMLKTDKSENTRKKYLRDITELQTYLSDESLKLSNAAVGAYVKPFTGCRLQYIKCEFCNLCYKHFLLIY